MTVFFLQPEVKKADDESIFSKTQHTMGKKKYEKYYSLAGKASYENWNAVKRSTICGCYYCQAIYSPSEITDEDWIQDAHGRTVLCPRCGIDAVIGDTSGIPIRKDVLEEIHENKFG